MCARTRLIHKAGAVIIRDGALLLVRNKGTQAYLMPGGRIETGEQPKDTLMRELYEELSLHTDPSTYEYVATYSDIAANDLDAFVEIVLFLVPLVGTPVMDSEVDSLLYWKPGDDDALLSPIVRDKILPDLRIRQILSSGIQ